jgi:hypothetical protein
MSPQRFRSWNQGELRMDKEIDLCREAKGYDGYGL